MRYHKWSISDLDIVRKYIKDTSEPYGAENLTVLASILGRSEESVRGAIVRALRELHGSEKTV